MKSTNKKFLGIIIKILICFLAISFINICSPFFAFGAVDLNNDKMTINNSDLIEKQARLSDVKKIEEKLEESQNKDTSNILEDFDPRSIISDTASGRFNLNLKSIVNGSVQYLLKEIYTNLHLLIKLLVLIIFCAILKNIQASFMSEGVGEIAFYVCYIVIVTVILVSFSTVMQIGIGMIDGMVNFMYATTPIMISLVVSGGSLTTGGVFNPLLLFIVEISAIVMKNVLIPMIFFSTILSIVNNISDKIQLSRLGALFKQITGWVLGTMLTVFVAVISLQGSLGAVVDGVTSKTAKFAIGTFIPVVGKTLADAADTVLGCTLLIKNAAGLAVLVGIVLICVGPLLKILALVALYKATSALVEPIAEKRITNCLSDVAGSMIYIFSVSICVAFMFMISITALISAGNLSAMIR